MLPWNMARCFGKCYPSGRDSSEDIHVLVFVSGVVYLSRVDAACNVVYLSGVAYIGVSLVSIITWFSTCSSSYPDFLFRQVVPVAFVVVCVV